MESNSLITEHETKYFLKSATVDDVDVYLNSIILIRKYADRDNKVNRSYTVKLTDNASSNAPSYQVGSNATGKEAIRNITHKHKISDGGSESENSTYISFFSEEI